MNIGAGRVVMQDLPRINAAMEDGSLAAHPELAALGAMLAETRGRVHVIRRLANASNKKAAGGTTRLRLSRSIPTGASGFDNLAKRGNATEGSPQDRLRQEADNPDPQGRW